MGEEQMGDHTESRKRIFKLVGTPNRLIREKKIRLYAVTELVFVLAEYLF
jgi:hypothetical protein